MHEIHILKFLVGFVLIEAALYVLCNLYLLVKWTRYYGRLSSAWGVVFHSEVRFFEFLPLFALGNGVLVFSVIAWGILTLLGVKVSLW